MRDRAVGDWIPLKTDERMVRAWLARPAGRPRGAVVVVQEIFGVNPHIRAVTDRFAEAGFIALAPSMFDMVRPFAEPDFAELNYDEAGTAQGREYAAELGFDRAIAVLQAAARWTLAEGHDAGAVGFCWGGTIAMLGNTRLRMPSVTYYGGRSVPFLDEPARAPMLFHFGEHDPLIPPGDVEQHRRHHPGATIHLYPAGHGFNCEQRSDYDAASAATAWSRTLAFLEEHLR